MIGYKKSIKNVKIRNNVAKLSETCFDFVCFTWFSQLKHKYTFNYNFLKHNEIVSSILLLIVEYIGFYDFMLIIINV